jgi:hypothetical protein
MVREIHSHAHEEGIPGTVNLKAVEGDDTYLGQAVFPVPSADPNDPLNWPRYKSGSQDYRLRLESLRF